MKLNGYVVYTKMSTVVLKLLSSYFTWKNICCTHIPKRLLNSLTRQVVAHKFRKAFCTQYTWGQGHLEMVKCWGIWEMSHLAIVLLGD